MIKQPKFSIIMSVYNVQEYIDKAIDSVLKQDIRFVDNVQLILVNDGSTDKSGSICQKYARKYPDNIEYIIKENGGLASASNVGLKHATGALVNFLDPDDILTLNVLSQVWSFWKRNKLFVDMVAIPLVYFGSESGLHEKYRALGNRNRIVNLVQEPQNAILSAASTFYNLSLLKNYKFDTKMSIGEDLKFNLQLYRNNPRFGYVCENGVQYMYRRRNNNSSLVDNLRRGNLNFIRMMPKSVPDVSKSSPAFEKELVVYQLRSALRELVTANCHDGKEYQQTMNELKQFADCLDIDFIIHHSYWCDTFDKKIALLKLLDINYVELINNGQLSFTNNIKLRERKIDHNTLTVDVIHNSYGANISVVAYDGNSRVIHPTERLNLSSPYDVIYGPFTLSDTTHTVFKFDVRRPHTIRFCFYNQASNTYLPIAHVKLLPSSQLSPVNTSCGIRYRNRLVTFNGRKLKISINPYRTTPSYNLQALLSIHRKYHKWAIWRLFAKRPKKYILINDRPSKADDNGEAIFRHINKYYPNLRKQTYYVVGQTMPRRERRELRHIGRTVRHDSVKHKILYLNSKYILSSHNHPTFYSAFNRQDSKYYADLLNYKFVWLQHGVTQNDISSGCNRLHVADDYIVSCTQAEAAELRRPQYFYKNDQIILTGFPRFDRLHDNPRNVIAAMPTWRHNLSGPIDEHGNHTALPNFENSDYYRIWSDFLSSSELRQLLANNNLVLKFILHAGASMYLDSFKKFADSHIQILQTNECIYRNIFAESKALITDYSSIAFDFSYLEKPLIYFQFDEDEFFANNYKRGYFDYRKDGFGKVVRTSDEVISQLEQLIDRGFKLEPKYHKRIKDTFPYHDHSNCERTLRAVLPEDMLK